MESLSGCEQISGKHGRNRLVPLDVSLLFIRWVRSFRLSFPYLDLYRSGLPGVIRWQNITRTKLVGQVE